MKKDTRYNKIKVNLIKKREINLSLLQLKKYFSYSEYQQCLQLLMKNHSYQEQLSLSLNVQSFSQLINEALFPMLLDKNYIADIKVQVKEFEFEVAYLGTLSNKIKMFNILRKDFEFSILNDNFEEAEKTLNKIQENFGYSFWYIESMMLFLRISGDSERLYEFYNKVKNESENPVINTYIRILQRKVRLDISNDEYKKFCKSQIKHLLEKYPDEKEMISYIEFMSFYDMKEIFRDDNNMLQHLLIIAQHIPFVDQYILFGRIDSNIRIQVNQNKNCYELTSMLKVADDFRGKINLLQYPVGTAQFHWGDEISVEYIKNHIDIEFELENKPLFQEGKYKQCIESCEKSLKKSFQFYQVRLLVQSYIVSNMKLEKLPEKTMLDQLIKKMCKICVKTSHLSKIEKEQDLPRFFMSCSFGPELLEFIYEQLYAPSAYDSLCCFYTSLYSRDTITIEHAVLLNQNDKIRFLDAWKKVTGKCIICVWSDNVRQAFKNDREILWDDVSKRINHFEYIFPENKKMDFLQSTKSESSLDIFLREQYSVIYFNNAVEYGEFEKAFAIYVNMFFLSAFSVLRMDIKKLNKRLNFGNCKPFYAKLDFIVYAYNVELHYAKPNITSQFVINSFLEILKFYDVDLPSSLKLPDDYLESWKMSYFLYYVCDLKMLNVKELYDIAAIEERKRILAIVADKYDCQNELKTLATQELDLKMEVAESYFNDNIGTFQMKAICASWIKIPNESLINTAFLQIVNHSDNNLICSNIKASWQYNLFRELIINCKGLYIDAINEKMGTTIRHCILERILIQNLTNKKVYLKDKYRIKDGIHEIPSLEKCDKLNQNRILICLSEFFDRFFLLMDSIRKQIYFTEQEDEEKIRFYIPSDFFIDGTKKIREIKSTAELNELVMSTLHRNLEKQINDLGDKIILLIRDGYKKEREQLKKQMCLYYGTEGYLQILDEAINLAIIEIRQQFGVTYNENQKYYLNSYLSTIKKQFPYISLINNCEQNMKVRNAIIWDMDIILKNCIENVEKHAEIPIEDANFKVQITKRNAKNIEMVFENYISSKKDKNELENTILEINQNIHMKKYLDIKTEDDDTHGMGYYRIARFLHDNLKEPWKLKIYLKDSKFIAFVSLGLEEKNEGINN